jgi:hypothetical protein
MTLLTLGGHVPRGSEVRRERKADRPANRMPYAGMANPSDRADLIAYLQKMTK